MSPEQRSTPWWEANVPDIYLYPSQANPKDIQLLDLNRVFTTCIPDAATLQLIAYNPLTFPMGLQLVGYVPAVTQAGGGPSDTTLTPTVGSLLLAGTGSLLGFNLLGATGTLTVTGLLPTVNYTESFTLIPGGGTLLLVGIRPTVGQSGGVVSVRRRHFAKGWGHV